MNIKVCPDCGSHNLATASFCAKCGQMLANLNIVEMDDDKVQLAKQTPGITPGKETPRPSHYESRPTGQILKSGCITLTIISCCLPSFLGLVISGATNGGNDAYMPIVVAFGSGIGGVIIGGLIWLIGWFWIWPTIDCFRNEPNIGNTKVLWVLITIFGGWPGGIIYLAVRRSQRIATYGR
jgi:hypothetical protein